MYDLVAENDVTIQQFLSIAKALIDDFADFAVDGENRLEMAKKFLDSAIACIDSVDQETHGR